MEREITPEPTHADSQRYKSINGLYFATGDPPLTVFAEGALMRYEMGNFAR